MTVLLLAGSGEAVQLARELANRQVDAVASLAGAVARPRKLSIPTISGGFGGGEQFLHYLQDANIHAVVDATHPFAAKITARTATLCAKSDLPYLRLERPEWHPKPGDLWQMIDAASKAFIHIQPSDVVFLATGRQTLPEFSDLQCAKIYCRQIDPPDTPFPFAGGEYVIGRPPFSIEEEIALFERLRITCLVVKNAGGEASRSKLDAARALGIRVLMIERPATPEAEIVETVSEAMAWIERLPQ